jgi:hypothetical protein
MNEAAIAEIVGAMKRQHPNAYVVYEFERTLALVPQDSGVWKIADLVPAVIILVPGDTLFTISIVDKDGTTAMRSCPLERDKILVGMKWGESTKGDAGQIWQQTHWTFRYVNQDEDKLDEWQRVTGRVRLAPGPEQLDRNELYARSLLSRVGRQVAIVEGDALRRVSE